MLEETVLESKGDAESAAVREAEANQAAAYGVRVEAAGVPAGASYWRCVDVRHLSADENRGKHNVFVRALDENGERVRDAALRIGWTWEGRTRQERADPKSLDKPDGEIGHGDVDLYQNQHAEVWLKGDNLSCDHVANLHTDHAIVEETSDGKVGNSRFHHSFVVTFQRMRKASAPAGDGEQPSSGANGAAPTPATMDMATFVREEDSTPDGTALRPGDTFRKVWVLRNTGSEAWTGAYRLEFVGGHSMGAPSSAPIPVTEPGAECRITLDLTVPAAAGRQRSTWRLVNAAGQPFGDPFWAEVLVLADGSQPGPGGVITLGPASSPEQRAVADTWNRYGAVILEECKRLGIDPAAAVAVLVTESRGEPFDAAGRLIIRFENHIFFRQWGAQHEEEFDRHFAFDATSPTSGHQWRTSPDGPMQPCHTSNAQEWAVLEFARRLDEPSALNSISMGAAQIMGFNHKAVGYATPRAMFEDFQRDANAQVRAMFRYMEVNSLVDAVRLRKFRRFAEVYNGPQRPDYYANLMHEYADTFAQLVRSEGREATHPAEFEAAATEVPRSPLPVSSRPGVPLAVSDPELYAAWRKHIESGFTNNDTMFRSVLDAFMNPYWSTVWMYRILFAVGVLAFVVAAVIGITRDSIAVTLVFGGLSIAAFLGYFVSRPLQAMEENLQFITWLGIIYNTYWSRLVQAQDPATYAKELDAATDDAIVRIQALIRTHAERSGARPGPQ